MKFPTEGQIEAIFSEMRYHANQADEQSEEEHQKDCDFCKFLEDIFKRNRTLIQKGELCQIDDITRQFAQGNPLCCMVFSMDTIGPHMVEMVTTLARTMFFLGMKSQLSLKDEEKLRKLFNKE